MSANDILFRYQPTGASAATSSQSARLAKEKITGVAASHELAKGDVAALTKCAADFQAVALKYGMPPALLAAIASRESHAGAALDSEGWGDHKQAFGMMQVDRRHHDIVLGDPRGRGHIDQATGVLKAMLERVTANHADWPEEQKLRGAVAAYNVGDSNVWTIEGMDRGTTGDDYSNDVWARAQYLAPFIGGADKVVAALPATTSPVSQTSTSPGGASSAGTVSHALVLELQHLLIRQGYMTEQQVQTGAGVLGPKTKAALARFLSDKSHAALAPPKAKSPPTAKPGPGTQPTPPRESGVNPPLLGAGVAVNAADPILQTLGTQPLETGKTGYCVTTVLANMRRLGVSSIPSSTGGDPNNSRGALVQMLMTGKWVSLPLQGSRVEEINSPYGKVSASVIPAADYKKWALAGSIPSGAIIFQTKHGWDYGDGPSGNDMGIVRDNGRVTFNYASMPPVVYSTCKTVVLLVPASALLRS